MRVIHVSWRHALGFHGTGCGHKVCSYNKNSDLACLKMSATLSQECCNVEWYLQRSTENLFAWYLMSLANLEHDCHRLASSSSSALCTFTYSKLFVYTLQETPAWSKGTCCRCGLLFYVIYAGTKYVSCECHSQTIQFSATTDDNRFQCFCMVENSESIMACVTVNMCV